MLNKEPLINGDAFSELYVAKIDALKILERLGTLSSCKVEVMVDVYLILSIGVCH